MLGLHCRNDNGYRVGPPSPLTRLVPILDRTAVKVAVVVLERIALKGTRAVTVLDGTVVTVTVTPRFTALHWCLL